MAYQPDGTAEIVQPCPDLHHRIPHNAHDWADSFGPAHCPGYSAPDEGHAEPALPQTPEEQVRDLQHILQRVREVVGTDQRPVRYALGLDQPEDRIAVVRALHQPVTDRTGWTGGEYDAVSPACSECGSGDNAVAWPCPTVRALDGEAT